MKSCNDFINKSGSAIPRTMLLIICKIHAMESSRIAHNYTLISVGYAHGRKPVFLGDLDRQLSYANGDFIVILKIEQGIE
jgi:hypothetical protein